MKASLFITCLGDMLFPEVGEAMVHLLRRQGVTLDFPPGQTCCGQPAWNMGHQEEAKEMARQWINTFERSEYIVSPSGSCVGHVRHFYPQMFENEPEMYKKAKSVAERTFEFTQFFVNVLGVTDVGARYKARAVFHSSCHMTRELGVRDEPFEMLKQVRDLDLVEMPRKDLCCGFGGGFSVKIPELSTEMVDQKIKYIQSTNADLLLGADGACLMNIAGRMERLGINNIKVMHIAELLWKGVKQA